MKLIHTSKLLQSWHPVHILAPPGVSATTSDKTWGRTERVVGGLVDVIRLGVSYNMMKVNIP